MDAINLGADWTVAELVTWWAASGFSTRHASRRDMLRRLQRHLLAQLGHVACADLSAEHIENALAEASKHVGPEALNHLRSDLRRCITAAKAARRWPWEDPTGYVKPRRVPVRMWRTLSADECRALLWGSHAQHLALFACALLTGMRKGELIALRVSDVDLGARRIYVQRSRRRDTTKNGRARIVPVSDELLLYLKAQLGAVCGDLVFPGRDGVSPRDVNAKLARAAQYALKKAGAAVSIRFQDLRHTFATRLRRAGVDRDLVAALLGHVGKSVTLLYTHFTESDLLNAVNQLALGAPRRMHHEG